MKNPLDRERRPLAVLLLCLAACTTMDSKEGLCPAPCPAGVPLGAARSPEPLRDLRVDAPPSEGAPLHTLYLPTPSFETAQAGQFGTGIALVDINRDGLPDMVVANGNDMSPQSLTVFYNRCSASCQSCFGSYPDWYSGDIGYHGLLSVGDIDRDGWLDVAVAVPFDNERNDASGSIKIYLNRGGALERLPSQTITGSERFGSFACALGDVNADGTLDLVVAPLTQAPPRGTCPAEPLQIKKTPARIFLNHDGRFHPESDWRSENDMLSLGVTVADINQDGWMDVAFAAEDTFVYYGGAPGGGAVPIPRAPAWTSAPSTALSASIDVARIGDAKALTLAVSRTCGFGQPTRPGPICTGSFVLFQPHTGASPTWSSDPTQSGSNLLLADLNADGLVELIGGQWGADLTVGAPLWFFQGRSTGYRTTPDFMTGALDGSSGLAVAEGLAVADTRGKYVVPKVYDKHADAAGAVITLPDRRIQSIVSVRVDDRLLGLADWTASAEQNWISLSRPFRRGATIRVEYKISAVQDVYEATWNPTRGDLAYDSFLNPTTLSSLPARRDLPTSVEHPSDVP